MFEVGLSCDMLCAYRVFEAGLSCDMRSPHRVSEVGLSCDMLCAYRVFEVGLSCDMLCAYRVFEVGLSCDMLCAYRVFEVGPSCDKLCAYSGGYTTHSNLATTHCLVWKRCGLSQVYNLMSQKGQSLDQVQRTSIRQCAFPCLSDALHLRLTTP